MEDLWADGPLLAGIQLGSPPHKGPDPYLSGLQIATFNGSSWATTQPWLEQVQAKIVCIQEHRLTKSKLADASQWAIARGWKSCWTAAIPSELGGPASGGVAILVKKDYGLEPDVAFKDDHRQAAMRLLAAWVEVPGHPKLYIGNGYLWTGQGADPDNVGLTRSFATRAMNQGHPWLMAGDFQATALE